MSDNTNPTTVLRIDKPWDIAHLRADPARQAADQAARAAERRYAALAGAKAADMLTQLLPTAHTVLVEVKEDEDNRVTLDLLTVRAADGALLLFTGDFEEIPEAIALQDAAESGGKPVPSFDRDTHQAIESLLFEVVEWGRSSVLTQVIEDIPVPFSYKRSLRDGLLWEMTLPDVTEEARKAHPQVMSEGGRLFPVSYESQDVDERDGVVTYWLPLVDEQGQSTFLDMRCWAGREAEASDLAVRTMWRFPDGSTWYGSALPSDADPTPQEHKTDGERTHTVVGLTDECRRLTVAGVFEGEHHAADKSPGDNGSDRVALVVIAATPEEAEKKAHNLAAHSDDDPPRRYTEHNNQLGDWCPWSGKHAPADSDDDDPCPALCPDSGTEQADEPDDTTA
ncbi:hypothetical protein KBX50_08325 [Micromonospora sp. C51]|uniref:hypothetical protein n=1 Tax=Micromonospora sp. C51 TaxID=2824879 RepID=UPI001B379868|nr:hypothetical protein [Micromonospora sp. C51]MBQ1048470.1 hypothetical protein [Micromonospora sp. C51]